MAQKIYFVSLVVLISRDEILYQIVNNSTAMYILMKYPGTWGNFKYSAAQEYSVLILRNNVSCSLKCS